MLACGTARRSLNSESGAVRLIVTVLVFALPITPPFSVQVAGFLRHALRADDARVEASGGRALHLEDALERRDDVVHRQRLPVRELDALAQFEDPGLAAVRRRGEVLCEVGHDRERGGAVGLLEGEQTVVGRLVQLPVLERVVDLRVERAARRLGDPASACRLGAMRWFRSARRRQSPAQTGSKQ